MPSTFTTIPENNWYYDQNKLVLKLWVRKLSNGMFMDTRSTSVCSMCNKLNINHTQDDQKQCIDQALKVNCYNIRNYNNSAKIYMGLSLMLLIILFFIIRSFNTIRNFDSSPILFVHNPQCFDNSTLNFCL